MEEIYLDNSATTRPLSRVREKILNTLTENYGNPSSLHKKGLEAEKILKNTRKIVATKLGVKPEEIYFTSGGTENNNLAIKGIAYKFQHRGRHLITTTVEHKSVLNIFKSLAEEGFEVTFLPVNSEGKITVEEFKKTLRPETILVSIMHVNNEIGTIQPVKKIAEIIKKHNRHTFFHVDGVQAFGKIFTEPGNQDIDLYTLSGHKIHGPKGIGALYIRKGIEIKPLLQGGGQEENIRPGTENIPGIAGLQAAVEELPEFSENYYEDKQLADLKNYFMENIKKTLPEVKINTPAESAPHIVSISIPGTKGEVMLHALSGDGIYISTGSACHTNSNERSNVLEAINLPPELREGTLRISFSHANTKEEIDYTIKRIKTHSNNLF